MPEAPKSGSEPKSANFECNICFEQASSPVVTSCGHLFCWSCLYKWLEQHPSCPCCKSGVSKDNVIPLYGRGEEQKDPREEIPTRPQGQRLPTPPPRNQNPFTNFFGGNNIFGGVGGTGFTFGFFPGIIFPGMGFTFGGGGGNSRSNSSQTNLSPEQQREKQNSKILIVITLALLWLIILS